MPTAKDAKNAKAERPPAPNKDDIHTSTIDTNPFPLDMTQGMLTRKALPPFNLHRTVRRRSSAEILADLDRIHHGADPASSYLTTPIPIRRPHTPMKSSRSSPPPEDVESDVFKTPEGARAVTELAVFAIDTSPPSSGSKRSVDTDGDVCILNAVGTSLEAAHYRLREEIRATVVQTVHDNFEFERHRLAEEIKRDVLATIEDDIKWLVNDNFDRALALAVGEPEESEVAAVQFVREKLRHMSDGAMVRVFCTQEMLEVLRKLVNTVDMDMKMAAWSLVETDDYWI
ncbi:hypothetical protein CCHL11_08533 [Colletotrichum chlorophyti]|uniref:Uncharacterized protein n=1 Tax=Colletotrichum chlorophyti TaxID=708187 RepID=A0A1Q8RQJ1_9PEZI|nr:hypothetical protein CCHL11_08533 [Colletotrichum chlorophyti]